MIGGTVIGIIRKPDGITTLHVRDPRSTDQCCVDCHEYRIDDLARVCIEIGDSVWWQSGLVLWTPEFSPRLRCSVDFDIHLPKVGYSHGFTHAIVGEPVV